MCDWMPSLEEQDVVEKYVLKRPLSRPDTDIRKAIVCVVCYLVSAAALSIISLVLLNRLGVFFYLPQGIIDFKAAHPAVFNFLYSLLVFILLGLILLKSAVIGCVKLYQHYADESIRRKCLIMPTCSEYAIIAIKKYGVIVGSYKTFRRLTRTCRGNVYHTDFP